MLALVIGGSVESWFEDSQRAAARKAISELSTGKENCRLTRYTAHLATSSPSVVDLGRRA